MYYHKGEGVCPYCSQFWGQIPHSESGMTKPLGFLERGEGGEGVTMRMLLGFLMNMTEHRQSSNIVVMQ